MSASQPQSRGVRDLAVRLAANGIPAGVISPDTQFTAVGRPPVKDPRGVEAFRAELPLILAEFERKNPSFLAQSLPGIVVVTSKDHPHIVADLLGRSVILPGVREATAGDAIFKHLAGRLRNTAITGLAGVGTAPGPSCPLGATVKFGTVSHTVSTFLNHVVQQVPGLVWVVTYDAAEGPSGIRIGIVCPDGTSLRTPIDG